MISAGILLTVVLLLVGFIALKRKTKVNMSFLIKSVAIIYFFVCFIKMLFADGFIWVINGGFYSGTLYQRTDILQTILRWIMYCSSGVIVVATFTKVKLFKNVSVVFALPLMVISLFFFPDFIAYYMDGTGRGFKVAEEIRVILLAIEFICGILLPLLFVFIQNHRFDVKSKKEWLQLCLLTPVLAFTMFPIYTFQSLFGYTNIIVGIMKPTTIIWIAFTIAITLLLVKIFKHRSEDEKFALCLWFALILFMHYNSLYYMGFTIERLPFQLCNLGAYFFLLCVVTRSKRLFDFAFVANIVGTMIAMIVPDIEGGIGYFWNIHFMLEHMLVLIVPAVMMGIGFFPRINKKSLKNIYVGFVIYFGFCLIGGGILNILHETTGETVNYFYLFETDLVMKALPGLSFVLNYKVLINGFYFYPVYIVGVFLVYSALMYLFYGLMQVIYRVADDQEEIWKNRKVLTKHLEDIKIAKQQRRQNVNN